MIKDRIHVKWLEESRVLKWRYSFIPKLAMRFCSGPHTLQDVHS